MKKINTLLFVLLALQINGQTYTEEIDAVYEHLDKSDVSSNILIDRVFPIANIQEFNQGTRIDTSSYMHFKQAWLEFYTASYLKNFNSLDALKLKISNETYTDNIIPIGIINT
jgi:hypothetical protein